LPLDGVRILDFGQAIQGPYATFLLAMAGAEVVKVEGLEGELTRRSGRVGAYLFEIQNTCKRSLAIDLKTLEGKEVIFELVKHFDVVLENFAPGVMDRLGLGPTALMAINPLLVYVSGSGYGARSARRGDVAMDSPIQATSGLMASTGEIDGPPLRAGAPIADVLSGTHLFGAVVAALYDAKVNGRGRIAEVAMLEAMIPLQMSNLNTWYLHGKRTPPRYGNRHGFISPHNVYRTSDGWIQLMCSTDQQWDALVGLIGDPTLESARFRRTLGRIEASDQIDTAVAAWVAPFLCVDVLQLLHGARVPSGKVRDLGEVLEDRDLRERAFLQDVEHPALGLVPMFGSALRFEGSEPRIPKPTVALGADTNEVLGGMAGLDCQRIAQLRKDGVIL
jgi:crotonobetainyl-CoA:carnitine CoA-transferase CaiB-like acyl-CoA transferase